MYLNHFTYDKFCPLLNPLKFFDLSQFVTICIKKTNRSVSFNWYPSWFDRAIAAEDIAFQNMTV